MHLFSAKHSSIISFLTYGNTRSSGIARIFLDYYLTHLYKNLIIKSSPYTIKFSNSLSAKLKLRSEENAVIIKEVKLGVMQPEPAVKIFLVGLGALSSRVFKSFYSSSSALSIVGTKIILQLCNPSILLILFLFNGGIKICTRHQKASSSEFVFRIIIAAIKFIP